MSKLSSLEGIMITSNKSLDYQMTSPLVLGAGLDLSKMTPTQLRNMTAGLVAGGSGPATKVKKGKKDTKPVSILILSLSFLILRLTVKQGQGKSKFDEARRENKATKEAAKSAPFVMADTPFLVPVPAVTSVVHASFKSELKKESQV